MNDFEFGSDFGAINGEKTELQPKFRG